MTRNGSPCQLPQQALPIDGIESSSSLLPTPVARDSKGHAAIKRQGGHDLATAIKLLPTPLTTDAQEAGGHGGGGMDLRTTVTRLYGTQEWQEYQPAGKASRRVLRPRPPSRMPTAT